MDIKDSIVEDWREWEKKEMNHLFFFVSTRKHRIIGPGREKMKQYGIVYRLSQDSLRIAI